MAEIKVTIDMGKRCAECGKGGAAQSGICLSCTTKAMGTGRMRSAIGRAAQKRIRASLAAARREHAQRSKP